jgi:VWFA-related protein
MGRRLLPLLSILAAAALSAQSLPAGQPPPTFQTTASLVRADVQVTVNHRPLPNLTAADFVLLDEGVPQPIAAFGRDSEPLQIALLLDVSGSMGKMLQSMAAVARQALSQLNPTDRVAVFLFSRHSRLTVELTGDFPLAARALLEAPLERSLGAGTSLNDALLSVAAYFHQQPPFTGRRAVIVLTDNGGVHFRVPDDDVIRAFSDAQAVLNAIVPSSAQPPKAPKDATNPDFTPSNVFLLTAATGGELLRSDDAGARFRELLDRIRLRYSLLLKPAPAPPRSFRRLTVDLSPGARRRFPRAELRARAGYFIPSDTPHSSR